MYLRATQRHNRDGSTVTYYALAEAVWNATAKRREARVIHSFGRADQVDHAALQRLVRSINRILGEGEGESSDPSKDATRGGSADIEIDAVFELGIPLVARHLWNQLGIGPAIRACIAKAGLTAPHETALLAMAAHRLDDPGSKRGCAERWLADTAWMPEAAELTVDV